MSIGSCQVQQDVKKAKGGNLAATTTLRDVTSTASTLPSGLFFIFPPFKILMMNICTMQGYPFKEHAAIVHADAGAWLCRSRSVESNSMLLVTTYSLRQWHAQLVVQQVQR